MILFTLNCLCTQFFKGQYCIGCMDWIKRSGTVLLSVATVLAGAVLFFDFFNQNLLQGFQNHAIFVRALLGILAVSFGLIGFWWFLKTKGDSSP